MYVPRSFAAPSREAVLEVIRRHALGIVMVGDHSGVEVAQAPCVLNATRDAIEFHLARANPLAKRFVRGESDAQVLFTGPDAYVSPVWYENPDANVPTWNYVSALVRGRVTPISDDGDLIALLGRMSREFEAGVQQSWTIDRLDPNKLAKLLREIAGFSLRFSSIEGKFKLSQNRPNVDRERVRLELLRSPSPDARAVAEWMES